MNTNKIKIILGIAILLLGVTGTSLGVFKAIENSKKAALQQTPDGTFTGTKTAIYYFNRGLDCVTCERIGGVADETIRNNFAQQLKDGQLEVKKVDYLLPENRHFEKLFNLSGSNILIANIKDGELLKQNPKPRNLSKMWQLKDTAVLKKYVHNEVQAMLDGKEATESTQGFVTVLVIVLWLGLLTSISPCPLATNIAAVSFISKQVASKKGVLWSGLMYTIGRAIVYVILASIVIAGLFQSSVISSFLEDYLNLFVGPLLLLAAPVMLGWVGNRLTFTIGSEKLHKRFAKAGGLGALVLGFLFALSLCPISAGIFFGPFLLTAIEAKSSILLPTIYGIATGFPVYGFAIVIAFASNYLGKTFHHLTAFEKWARLVTGVVFILIGVYLTLYYTAGIVLF